ncbi:Endoglucanase-4, partial [Lachnellula suecica]
MSLSKIAALSGAVAFATIVAAHGTVTGIVADGTYYAGYHADYQYMATAPVVVGWSTPEDLSNGFIAPSAFATADMICHLGATNAQTSASVKAGGSIDLQWTAWPSSHHGPVIDYLANCGGDCTTVDKTTLEFFKIDGVGLIDDTTVPGNWASDELIANNNTWTVTIPTDIAPGNYVLRHEIIALHSAGSADGAQSYPQCFNLEVTGSGTAAPSGTLGTALYTATDPGILVNIYQTLASYVVPGPALYSGAVSATQSTGTSATSVASVATSSSVEAVTTSAASVGNATSVTSSPASSITSAAVLAVSAPFNNGTAKSTKKSACSKKSNSSSFKPVSSLTQLNQISKATLSASDTIPTFAPTVTIATTSSSIVPTSTPATSVSGSDSTSTATD